MILTIKNVYPQVIKNATISNIQPTLIGYVLMNTVNNFNTIHLRLN